MPRTKQFDEQQVLEKAMTLFWEQGFHATSIQDLVDRLGVNRASLYSTYGDKQTLFGKTFQHYRQTNFVALKDLFESAPDVRDAFRKMFGIVLQAVDPDCAGKGCFVVNTSTEMLPTEDGFLPILRENRAALVGIFVQAIARDVSKGLLSERVDPAQTAAFMFTFYNGLQVVSKYHTEPEALKQQLEVALQVFSPSK